MYYIKTMETYCIHCKKADYNALISGTEKKYFATFDFENFTRKYLMQR